jgi:hypothetical protein
MRSSIHAESARKSGQNPAVLEQ